MIRPSTEGSEAGGRPRWIWLVGAALAAAPAIYLTYAGVDYARNGCDCREAFFPDWIWAVMLALSAPFYAAALALAARASWPRRRET